MHNSDNSFLLASCKSVYDVGGKTSGPVVRWRDHAGNNIKRFLTRGDPIRTMYNWRGARRGYVDSFTLC